MKALLICDTLINKNTLIKFKEADLSIFSITSNSDVHEQNKEATKIFSSVNEFDSSLLINDQVYFLNDSLDQWFLKLCNQEIKGRKVSNIVKSKITNKSTLLFSDLAEKNTFKNKNLFPIVQIKALIDLISKEEFDILLLAIKDPLQKKAIFKLKNLFKYISFHDVSLKFIRKEEILDLNIFVYLKSLLFIFRSMIYSILTKLINRKSLKLGGEEKILFISYFPYLDLEAKRKGIFKNLYFSHLQEFLQKANTRVAWALIYVRIGEESFFSAVKTAKKLINEPFIFLEGLLNIRDYLAVFFDWTNSLVNYLQIRKELNAKYGHSPEGLIIMSNLDKSYFGSSVLNGILYSKSFDRLARTTTGTKISQTIYLNEMQTWEKAFNLSFKKNNPSTTRVGYQHTSVSKRMIHYFRRNEEQLKHTDEELPSVFAVNGNKAYDLLKGCPYNTLKLEALRKISVDDFSFKEYKNNLQFKDKSLITFLGSIERPESESILHKISRDFSKREEFTIEVVSHPSCDLSKLCYENSLKLGVNLVHSTDFNQSLLKSTYAVVGSSTASIDALRSGCQVIIPILPDKINLNPILEDDQFFMLCPYNKNLFNIVKEIELLDREDEYHQDVHRYINNFWKLDKDLSSWKELLEKTK